jgi:fumarate reductase flavoprotein subunit
MEMVQFHPTGLLAGPDTRMTGTVLEEGLRGAGGWLTDANGRRFMTDYDKRGERATRDIVSRAIFAEIKRGVATPLGGVYLEMRHLGAERVRAMFKGMVERCADCGFDLAAGRVEVIPTAHYMMGGVEFDLDCRTAVPGLYAAGEDTGGVHGANRLGGNGVANSTVFGGIAGAAIARDLAARPARAQPDMDAVEAAIAAATAPFRRRKIQGAPKGGDLEAVREHLYDLMWEQVGIVRDAAGLDAAGRALEALDVALDDLDIGGGGAFNPTWHDWLNLKNLVLVSGAICVAAQAREDSRGAHWRHDFPRPGDLAESRYTRVWLDNLRFRVTTEPVAFTRVRPGESLVRDAAD